MLSVLRSWFALTLTATILLGAAAAQEGGPGKGPPPEPARKPLDRFKLPPGASIFIMDHLKDALQLIPKMVVLAPDEYQKLLDRIQLLEKQLKPRKSLPQRCRITATPDGEIVKVRAEMTLEAQQAGEMVNLGFRGTTLVDAEVDEKLVLSLGDDGYQVQTSAAGEYTVALHFRLPLASRRLDALGGGGLERGFELNLPGAAVTTLELTLPRLVKELKRNEQVEKGEFVNPQPGSWELTLGTARQQKFSWREPAPGPVGPLLSSARWDVVVRLLEGQARTTATLTLIEGAGDKGRPIDRKLVLPAEVHVEIRAPEPAAYEVTRNEKTGLHQLRGPATPSLTLVVTQNQPRSNARLPIGPYLVLGMDRQEGEFEVRAAPEQIRGLHCNYVRRGDLRQQDIPSPSERSTADLLALFRSWNLSDLTRLPKIKTPLGWEIPPPLEVELKPVAPLVETTVEHHLRLRRNGHGWEILAVTRLLATPVHGTVDFLDVLLPRPQPGLLAGMNLLAGFGRQPFPGNLLEASGAFLAEALAPLQPPEEYLCNPGEGMTTVPDLQMFPGRRKGRIHLRLQKQPFSVALMGTYRLRGEQPQVHLELPRPLTLDRGAKVRVEIEDGYELLLPETVHGSEFSVLGFPPPVLSPSTSPKSDARSPKASSTSESGTGDRRMGSYLLNLTRAPATIQLAWRPYRPQLPVTILADVTLERDHATVTETLQFSSLGLLQMALLTTNGEARTTLIHLEIPPAAGNLRLLEGGQAVLVEHNGIRRLRCSLTGSGPLRVQYSLPAPRSGEKLPVKASDQTLKFELALLWPVEATRAEARARLWTPPGTLAVLSSVVGPGARTSSDWQVQRLENVPGHDALPTLVATLERGFPEQAALRKPQAVSEGLPPLVLSLEGAVGSALPAVLVERALIRTEIEEGGTVYRARFLLGKLAVPHLDIHLPASPGSLQLEIRLDGKQLPWKAEPAGERVIRILVPAGTMPRSLLEVKYRVPSGEGGGLLVWQTQLTPPLVKGDVFVQRQRWQVHYPPGRVPLPFGQFVYSPVRWTWRGWLLTPELAESSGQLERWITGAPSSPGEDQHASSEPASLGFWGPRPGDDPEQSNRAGARPRSADSITLLLLPRLVWLLLCSGVFLAVGLLLRFTGISWTSFWVILCLLGAGAVAVGLTWTGLLPVLVYGCQPGLVVLLLILAGQWLLQSRYRRQVIFLPGFTRLSQEDSRRKVRGTGSSLVRSGAQPAGSGSGNLGPRGKEPSTVDAIPLPPPRSKSTPPSPLANTAHTLSLGSQPLTSEKPPSRHSANQGKVAASSPTALESGGKEGQT